MKTKEELLKEFEMKTKKELLEYFEELLEVKENADRLIANPKAFATLKIEGKVYLLITRLQLLSVIENTEKLK